MDAVVGTDLFATLWQHLQYTFHRSPHSMNAIHYDKKTLEMKFGAILSDCVGEASKILASDLINVCSDRNIKQSLKLCSRSLKDKGVSPLGKINAMQFVVIVALSNDHNSYKVACSPVLNIIARLGGANNGKGRLTLFGECVNKAHLVKCAKYANSVIETLSKVEAFDLTLHQSLPFGVRCLLHKCNSLRLKQLATGCASLSNAISNVRLPGTSSYSSSVRDAVESAASKSYRTRAKELEYRVSHIEDEMEELGVAVPADPTTQQKPATMSPRSEAKLVDLVSNLGFLRGECSSLLNEMIDADYGRMRADVTTLIDHIKSLEIRCSAASTGDGVYHDLAALNMTFSALKGDQSSLGGGFHTGREAYETSDATRDDCISSYSFKTALNDVASREHWAAEILANENASAKELPQEVHNQKDNKTVLSNEFASLESDNAEKNKHSTSVNSDAILNAPLNVTSDDIVTDCPNNKLAVGEKVQKSQESPDEESHTNERATEPPATGATLVYAQANMAVDSGSEKASIQSDAVENEGKQVPKTNNTNEDMSSSTNETNVVRDGSNIESHEGQIDQDTLGTCISESSGVHDHRPADTDGAEFSSTQSDNTNVQCANEDARLDHAPLNQVSNIDSVNEELEIDDDINQYDLYDNANSNLEGIRNSIVFRDSGIYNDSNLEVSLIQRLDEEEEIGIVADCRLTLENRGVETMHDLRFDFSNFEHFSIHLVLSPMDEMPKEIAPMSSMDIHFKLYPLAPFIGLPKVTLTTFIGPGGVEKNYTLFLPLPVTSFLRCEPLEDLNVLETLRQQSKTYFLARNTVPFDRATQLVTLNNHLSSFELEDRPGSMFMLASFHQCGCPDEKSTGGSRFKVLIMIEAADEPTSFNMHVFSDSDRLAGAVAQLYRYLFHGQGAAYGGTAG
ncbi:hypothetical protein, conserved [Babesia bigemina]|uniref:Uncharacterized protein n=1 Tax=Babesia bigemina TaxID=5866 RepID=A0A061DDD1_BABBI|nr:hypothetical protein, conserved [Babesia bigemina]CDR96175.1 hypothetical protein, conserved [Babesia bigemina]|eukprot:XP_012768361.1 hypothetical protein, conserved [Babesia bigemina]